MTIFQAAAKEFLQGGNLPENIRSKTQDSNWKQFRQIFGVLPEDYQRQTQDLDKGGEKTTLIRSQIISSYGRFLPSLLV